MKGFSYSSHVSVPLSQASWREHLFWPFLDALEEERNIFKRPILLTGVFITLFVWLLLTYWGMQ